MEHGNKNNAFESALYNIFFLFCSSKILCSNLVSMLILHLLLTTQPNSNRLKSVINIWLSMWVCGWCQGSLWCLVEGWKHGRLRKVNERLYKCSIVLLFYVRIQTAFLHRINGNFILAVNSIQLFHSCLVSNFPRLFLQQMNSRFELFYIAA